MTPHVAAGERLKRALEQSAERAGFTIDWVSERTSPFTSPSFVGGSHDLCLLVGSSDGGECEWLDQLDEHAFALPGFVLAQMDVGTVEPQGDGWMVSMEALTIKEA